MSAVTARVVFLGPLEAMAASVSSHSAVARLASWISTQAHVQRIGAVAGGYKWEVVLGLASRAFSKSERLSKRTKPFATSQLNDDTSAFNSSLFK